MDLSSIKSVRPNRNIFKKIMAVLFSLAVIGVSFYVITTSNEAAKDTVEVLRIKQKGGAPAYVPLTEEHIEKYDIIKKEYSSDMILASDMDEVIDKYTQYYLRDGSILYADQLSVEKPQKNEWLYRMEETQELLTLPYNYMEAGGDILMPGDRVRIRVSYERDKAVPAGNPNGIYQSSGEKVRATDVLFDSIVVKDMLNSNSHSIYEVYKEVLKLNDEQRQTVMKSDDFMKSILPKALLLEGSSEQIQKYAKYIGLPDNTILITILSRNNSDVIIDQLPTLQKEVESWVDKQKEK